MNILAETRRRGDAEGDRISKLILNRYAPDLHQSNVFLFSSFSVRVEPVETLLFGTFVSARGELAIAA